MDVMHRGSYSGRMRTAIRTILWGQAVRLAAMGYGAAVGLTVAFVMRVDVPTMIGLAVVLGGIGPVFVTIFRPRT